MSLTYSSFLFLPFMPSAIFRIPIFHTGLNYKGSRRDMALNTHIKTKPESTDSRISYIPQETKKNSLHIPVWSRQYFAKLTTEFTQEKLNKNISWSPIAHMFIIVLLKLRSTHMGSTVSHTIPIIVSTWNFMQFWN